MSQNKKEERYLQMLKDVNGCLSKGNLVGCFPIIKNYIPNNNTPPDDQQKIDEVVHFQSRHSRLQSDKRIQLIAYREYNSQLSILTNDIQEFIRSLKPEGIEDPSEILPFTSDSKNHDWNFDNNYIVKLVFQSSFGLLDAIFKDFIVAMKRDSLVRINRHLFDQGKLILIDEGQYYSLNENEKSAVVVDYMEWSDAAIIQKKQSGFVITEAFVIKRVDQNEIAVRTIGDIQSRREITLDIINWFRVFPNYSKLIKEPFSVFVPYSNMDILQFIDKY